VGRQRIHLRGTGPHFEGKTWQSDYLLRIGRLEDLEIVLDDASVSRRHAEVAFTDQGWVVRDLGSTNGTFVNGVRVGRAGQALRQRDHLTCGNIGLTVAALEERGGPSGDGPGGVQVVGSVQGTWDQALQALTGADGPPLAKEQLVTLLRVGRDFSLATSLEGLLDSILKDALSALGSARGAVLLADDTTSRLTARAAYPPSVGGLEEPAWVNFPLAQGALDRGESLLGVETAAEGGPAGTVRNSVLCALLRSPHKRLGVLYLDRGAYRTPFTPADLRLADALAASVSSSVESVGNFLEKERDLFIHMLTALAQAVELRDDYTGGHTQRVTDYALLIAEELRMSPQERHLLQVGTPLHDIGKIGINDSILRKNSRLTEEEFGYMKSHTWKGAAIIEIIPHLRPILPIIRHHHEHWDGTGYPDGLAGSQISPLGRVVAVADAFDAMTTDRPYRPGIPSAAAFEEIRRKAGTQFDPDCAHAFLRLRPRIEDMLRQMRLLSETAAGGGLRTEGGSPAVSPSAVVSGVGPAVSSRRTVALPRVNLEAVAKRKTEPKAPKVKAPAAPKPAEQPEPPAVPELPSVEAGGAA
jgi:HD-GYP domain-containing protein (c-di-GMP phosphodiesterase class II)/pSer/pThr/pTyr-binding forkhead associated (FHA) protein